VLLNIETSLTPSAFFFVHPSKFKNINIMFRKLAVLPSSGEEAPSMVHPFFFFSSSFPLGFFSLCFRKHLNVLAYYTIPRIGPSNFLQQFRAAKTPKQRRLEL
jgi:hypothetical protein